MTDKPVKAYRTRAIGTDCVVFARTPGAARYATVKGANEAGYKISFGDVRFVRRAPELDKKIGSRPVGRCYKPSDFCKAP